MDKGFEAGSDAWPGLVLRRLISSYRSGGWAARPGVDRSAAELLAYGRDVLGIGVETIGTDVGEAGSFDPPFPAHAIMHGAGKFGLASLCNLDQLPRTGAVVIGAPPKIVDGSGSPVREIAISPS
jgi:isatin hydrolase